jgi:predicted RNase H-like HicB family nuclease
METTAQRTSRIANEDSAAHTAYAHAQDFFNGLATYHIEPQKNDGFWVYVNTPHGRTTASAKTLEKAEAIIAEWKAETHFAGYPKTFFIKD